MKPFAGFAPAQSAAPRPVEQIPAGAYVARILMAEVVGDYLVLKLDIAEGLFTGYYDKLFQNAWADASGAKKWKGTYRIRIPKEGTDYYDRDLARFNGDMWLIMDANPGYEWDWNEESLVLKLVGITIREAEYDVNGYSGVTTEIGRLERVSEVRAGKTHAMRRRTLRPQDTSRVTASVVAAVPPVDDPSDEDPFKY